MRFKKKPVSLSKKIHIFGRGERSVPKRMGQRNRLTKQLSGGFNKKLSKIISPHILIFCLSITFAGVALGISFFSPFFEVSDVIVSRDAVFVDVEEVQSTMSQVIGQRMWFLPIEQLERELLTLYPSLKTVKINKVYPKTLRVELQNHEVFSLMQRRGDDNQFVLFDNGVLRTSAVLGDNTESIDGLLTMVVPSYAELGAGSQDLLQEVFPIGDKQPFLDEDSVKDAQELITLFEKNFSRVDNLEYFPLENEIHIILGSGTRIMFWMDKDIETQLFKLKTASGSADINSGELAYVDLRIIDRIDICRVGSTCASSNITK